MASGTGRQIAAALALGAQGVWLGSLWLTTAESNAGPGVLESYLDATSSDTVRSRCYTGKPARMLRNKWTEAWEDDAGPGALGMPLQNILTSEANSRIARTDRPDLQFAPVGQIVGRMNEVRPVRDVIFRAGRGVHRGRGNGSPGPSTRESRVRPGCLSDKPASFAQPIALALAGPGTRRR